MVELRGKDGTNVAPDGAVTAHDLLPASQGAGPLLERDYWAVLTGCALKPSDLMAHVKSHFCELPPRALVEFDASDGLEPGATLDIRIAPAQRCGVRVIHQDAQSLTLATLSGHPEAGRITFGAYRNAVGDVIFHIRSRARSTTTAKRLGFLAIGDAMQTNTWTGFIQNVATAVGAQIRDAIHAETKQVDDVPEDDEPLQTPTFVARGD
jgi:hypothetical protein